MSQTVQGAIIAALPVIGTYFKIDFGDADALVKCIVGLVGLAITVWGRLKAVKKITVLPAK